MSEITLGTWLPWLLWQQHSGMVTMATTWGDGYHGHNMGRWLPWQYHREMVTMAIAWGDGYYGNNMGGWLPWQQHS